MTYYRGHYLPVAARREVLKIYRDRRSTSSWAPWATAPLAPMAAMRETVRFFEGWLTEAAAFGPIRGLNLEDLIDQVRAADYYMTLMYEKPSEFKNRGRASLVNR